jgi:hypothetical protein
LKGRSLTRSKPALASLGTRKVGAGDTANSQRTPAAVRIILRFLFAGMIMEAERVNAVENRIVDLAGRGDQLRRYL